MKTPTWREVEQFCERDGWREIRETGHRFFQKVLADGTVLETHSSFSSRKTMSPKRFRTILRDQLRVTEAQFWEVLRTEKPAKRPSVVPAGPIELPAYIVRVLKLDLHMTEDQIAGLTAEEGRKRVADYWSRQPPS